MPPSIDYFLRFSDTFCASCNTHLVALFHSATPRRTYSFQRSTKIISFMILFLLNFASSTLVLHLHLHPFSLISASFKHLCTRPSLCSNFIASAYPVNIHHSSFLLGLESRAFVTTLRHPTRSPLTHHLILF